MGGCQGPMEKGDREGRETALVVPRALGPLRIPFDGGWNPPIPDDKGEVRDCFEFFSGFGEFLSETGRYFQALTGILWV